MPRMIGDAGSGATPADEAALRASALPATLTWLPAGARPGKELTVEAAPNVFASPFETAEMMRRPTKYPKQPHRHGRTYVEACGHHVWYESGLEASVLRRLDMSQKVVEIAAQPMLIRFADGARHTPDYFALLRNGARVIVDVKHTGLRTENDVIQFAKTNIVASHIGWHFLEQNELPQQVEINLGQWIDYFKHPGFYIGEAGAAELRARTGEITSVGAAAAALGARSLAAGRDRVYHLVWRGDLSVDLTRPLSDRTELTWRAR